MKLRWNVLLVVVANCALFAVGCGKNDGPKTYVVKGTVTLDGQPLATGRINLVPTEGKGGSVGGEIKNGKYEVRIVNGPKTVEITSEKVTGKQKAYPNDPASPEFDIKEQIIPAKYNTNTELKVLVKDAGTTEENFTLVSEAPATK
jgi:hypothetical protein